MYVLIYSSIYLSLSLKKQPRKLCTYH